MRKSANVVSLPSRRALIAGAIAVIAAPSVVRAQSLGTQLDTKFSGIDAAIAALQSGGGAGLPMFIVNGGTETAINTALAAAATAGGGDVILENLPYQIVNGIQWPACENIRLRAGGGRSEFVAPSSGAINLIQTSAASVGAAVALSANAALFATAAQFSSVTGFSVGGLFYVQKTLAGGVFYTHVAEVTAINGTTVSFSPGLPFTIATSDTLSIVPFMPRGGIVIEGIRFSGNNNSGIVQRAILSQFSKNAKFIDLTFKDFTGAAAAYLDYGLGTGTERFTVEHCGSAQESDITWRSQTSLSANNTNSRNASGFGPQLFMCNSPTVSHLSSLRANGRGVKLNGVLNGTFFGIEGSYAPTTGVAITLGSCNNRMFGVTANSNRGFGSNEVGVWFSDSGNKNNIIDGLVAFNNGWHDIELFTTDTDNVIRCARWSTLQNLGTNNTISAT